MLPLLGLYVIVRPGTVLPCWSWISALIVNDSSAVIDAVVCSTTSVTGNPGVTVILSVVQITPKHAVML